jgi:carbon monoxide dehydrogenase subunit G
MIQSQKTIDISANVQSVWDFLTDFPHYPSWMTDVVEVTLESEPVQRGTNVNIIRLYGNRRVNGVEKITEFEPLKCLRLQTPSGSFIADAVYTLEAQADGTRLHYAVKIVGHGFGKLLEWFIKSNFQKLVDGEFARIKTLLESKEAVA